MNMVEKVALAIHAADQGIDVSEATWDGLEDNYDYDKILGKQECLHLARAAIAAMRKPTDAMLEAAFGTEFTLTSKQQRNMALDLHNAMIDAALLERE